MPLNPVGLGVGMVSAYRMLNDAMDAFETVWLLNENDMLLLQTVQTATSDCRMM